MQHAWRVGAAELACRCRNDVRNRFLQTMRQHMADSTVKKVTSGAAPTGEMGQVYLASGMRVSMRLWNNEPPQTKEAVRRDYETVGYVIAGRAELTIEQQTVKLEPGDSWLVPANSEHSYRILEKFTAVEATAPPAQVHGRDAA
jgi:quercetin dioxygenase-like cupin family protein